MIGPYCILLLASFFHKRLLMVFHWILSDSKFLRVSRTFPSILVDLSYVVVLMVSVRHPISNSSSPFTTTFIFLSLFCFLRLLLLLLLLLVVVAVVVVVVVAVVTLSLSNSTVFSTLRQCLGICLDFRLLSHEIYWHSKFHFVN